MAAKNLSVYMGIREREIIAQHANAHQENAVITLEMVDRLKPVGRALPDRLPLGYMGLLSDEYASRRERETCFRRLEDAELVEPVEAWRGATVELPLPQRLQLKSTFDLLRDGLAHDRKAELSAEKELEEQRLHERLENVLNLETERSNPAWFEQSWPLRRELIYEYHIRYNLAGRINVGRIRRMTFEGLKTIPQIGNVRAAFLKEVFGESSLDAEHEEE